MKGDHGKSEDHRGPHMHLRPASPATRMTPATVSILSVVPASLRRFIPFEENEENLGLLNAWAFLFLILWYIFSGFTLFLNKYILTTLRGDPPLLGAVQMVMTTVCGFIQMYLPLGMYTPVIREEKPPNFWQSMLIAGCMRFTAVVLGLVSLKYVAVSFTETVKSSAPLFTVFISRVLISEHTGLYTFLSLIPITLGLGLCSVAELSFNVQGFFAALGTNLVDCLQNVYSKLLISGEKYRYTPAELQFYTSIAAVVVQIPVCFLMMDVPKFQSSLTFTTMGVYFADGLFFHLQSISAYVLMGYISPVTHSVANTVKRAVLIWLSVLMFGNPVTFLSGLGTITVTVGVLMYTKAKEYDHTRRELRVHYTRMVEDAGKLV